MSVCRRVSNMLRNSTPFNTKLFNRHQSSLRLMMETCVLIPQELSLGLAPCKIPPGIRVGVWTNRRLTEGMRLLPFQGTIRLDTLHLFGLLEDDDVRHRFGCYDEIAESDGRRARHCNWVRFLRAAQSFTPEVNIVGTRVKGEPVFEAIRPIPPQTELVAFFLPERPEELFLPAVRYLRTSFYRRTMDSILEDSPLDLSMSLLSRPPLLGGALLSESDLERISVCSEVSVSGSSTGDPESPGSSGGGLSRITASGLSLGGASIVSTTVKKPRERTLLPCEVCGKAFDRPSLLKRHMRTHTGEKPHVCDVCGKGFSTSSSLNTHRRIHSGEKPHQCQVCGKRFTASSNLYYHRMTHIKEKPHKCQLCSKSFPTPGDLKSHMYVHNGSWPFKCHICSRGFSKHTNLKNHLFLHTGDKPHSCNICQKKFALACNLRAHMKTHEGEIQEDCANCGKTFLTNPQTSTGFGGLCAMCGPARGLPLIKENMREDSGPLSPEASVNEETD